VGYVELVGSDGIVSWTGDGSRKRHGDDYGYVGFSQYDCDDDGESSRVERDAVTDEPVSWVDRGNVNAHTDR